MKELKIALKLGASETQLCISEQGYILSEPSYVYNQTEILVGKKAKNKISEFAPVISPIKNGNVVNKQEFVLLIKHILSKCEIKGLIPECYVSIPNGISINSLQTMEECLMECGIVKVTFVNQNICAYNVLNKNNSARVIVNMGATGTDISVVKNDNIIAGINLDIGGNNLDQSIMKFCNETFSIDISQDMAEQIKLNIGTLSPTSNFNYNFYGLSVNSNKFAKNNISSYDIYGFLQEYYGNICTAIETVLNTCSTAIFEEISENGIDFIGSGSLITGLKELVDLRLNLKANIYNNATEIVALGLEQLV